MIIWKTTFLFFYCEFQKQIVISKIEIILIHNYKRKLLSCRLLQITRTKEASTSSATNLRTTEIFLFFFVRHVIS